MKLRVLGVIRILEFFFRVQMVKVAIKFVESVVGRQVLIPVTEMVLTNLRGGVTVRLEQFGDRWVFFDEPLLRTGQSDLD